MTLQESLESYCLPIFEKFDTQITDIKLIEKTAAYKRLNDGGREVAIKFLKEIFGGNIDVTIDDSDKNKYIKIPRSFCGDIDKVAKDFKGIEVIHKGGTNRTIRVFGTKFAVTGSGSVGRAATEAQESATCIVWNEIMKELTACSSNVSIKDITDSLQPEYIKEIASEISKNLNPSWQKSIQLQITAIVEFLEKRDIGAAQIIQYRACRYGDHVQDRKSYKSKEGVGAGRIGHTYKNFLDAYGALVRRESGGSGQKDTFDPSDIVIYKTGTGVDVEQRLKNLIAKFSDFETSEPVIDEYKKLFDEKLMYGISLKKCKGAGTYELYNLGRNLSEPNISISEVRKIHVKNGARLKVTGQFNTSRLPDSTGEGQFKTKTIIVTMRTFGSGSMDIDIKEENAICPIGKCPRYIWNKFRSKYLEVDEVSVFKSLYDNENWDYLRDVISGGMKNGPWCLPFILIH